ncbi:MAG: corrinoid protein [Candidatus Bathyarchaeia archaeon]
MESELEALKRYLVDLDFDKTIELTRELIDGGVDPLKIIEACREALDEVGRRYESGEYFLSELIMAGDLMKEILSTVEPKIFGGARKTLGKIVVGTVQGDLHDIGKNIFIMLAKAQGFEVIDLGIDVPADRFVEAIRSEKPQILAMSALLSVTAPYMGDVVEALKREGLRERVKVIIGGAAVSSDFGRKIGADYAAKTAVEGVDVCRRWLMEGKA